MKKQRKKRNSKKISSHELKLVTSNLKSEQDYKQFAQKMSGVLSALANNFSASESGEHMTSISSGN